MGNNEFWNCSTGCIDSTERSIDRDDNGKTSNLDTDGFVLSARLHAPYLPLAISPNSPVPVEYIGPSCHRSKDDDGTDPTNSPGCLSCCCAACFAAQLVSHAQSARRISRQDDQSSDSHQRQRILAGAKRRAAAMPWPAHLYTGASHGS